MIPILYSPTETTFANNGIGALTDAVSCIVTEQRNGSYELKLVYPIQGIHYTDIRHRSLISAKPNQVDNPQLFRVYAISKTMGGKVTFRARHISYDLSGKQVIPFAASGVVLALQGLISNCTGSCDFTFWTDKTTQGEYRISVPQSIRACMGGNEESILARYGGEYAYDNFTVKLYQQRGQNRGVTIRYGKNLTDLHQEENCANVCTGVLPYWADQDGNLVMLPERIVQGPGEYGFSHERALDCSSHFQEQPSVSELRAYAEQYILDNHIGVPKVSLRVSFENLEKYEGPAAAQRMERVLLCDTVSVVFPALGVDATAKAIEVKYDALRDKVQSITLGDSRPTIADTIVGQQAQLDKKPDADKIQSQIQQQVGQLSGALLGATGGAVRLLDTDGDNYPDTLYIADSADPTQANKVWRFNYEGWGASQNGYNGPFILGASFDSGILADFITAGTLDANLIKAGVLQSLDGNFRFNLQTGEIYVGGYATKADTDSLGGAIDANSADINTVRSELAKITMQSGQLAVELQDIVDNGVSKVKTTTGYTFDSQGLHIAKPGFSTVASRLDHTGLYVTNNGQPVLTANDKGVDAWDLHARNYLIVGDHLRIENYDNGQDANRFALFWLGGA